MCKKLGIVGLLLCTNMLFAQIQTADIIEDIYRQLTEVSEVDYEELEEDLQDLAAHPIDLNSASESDLQRLRFLSPRQIDDILLYVYQHPMDSLYELRLIRSLAEYDIRNLCAFVTLRPVAHSEQTVRAKEAMQHLKHELSVRLDARNCEQFVHDPMYVQTRYVVRYRDQFDMRLQLRRPAGGDARSLQYGGFLRLQHVGPLRTLVAGTMQAGFGQGLVLAPAMRMGKTAYVTNVGYEQEGVRGLSTVDGSGLHGIGTTLEWQKGKNTVHVSALYSLQRTRDSIRHHVLGANITFGRNRWKVGFTAVENLYSDSTHPYQNTAYNRHYFRGRRQAVMGLNARYVWRWLDLFGEVATAQNERWGVGVQTGARFAASENTNLTLLYRYYSPWFDNALGYAFSETSRIGDEQGIYLGMEVHCPHQWLLRGYADLFRFSGIKYGIHYAPSYGYDAMLEAAYIPNDVWSVRWRARAREKGRAAHYSLRGGFCWQQGGWSLKTTAEANLTQDSLHQLGWGLILAQDLAYTWQHVPLTLQVRLEGFDAREWNNRFYLYEHDVLYAMTTPAIYGRGGRAYINLRWKIIDQLTLYLKLSETVYEKHWASAHNKALTRTDIHLMLRATLP